MLQLTSLVGIYGLSLVTVTAAALPARLGDLERGRLGAVLAAILLIAVPGVSGAWRLAHSSDDMVPGVMLRLVQPSIPETLKNDPQIFDEKTDRLVTLSKAPGADQITAIIWPEAAAPPFYAPPLPQLFADRPMVQRSVAAWQAILNAIPRHGLLLAGAERAELIQRQVRIWNSLVVRDAEGDVVATYDKAHLVPFGEYMPLRGIVPIDKIVPSIGDFSTGSGPRTLDLPGLPPVGPLICYEAIFPGAVIDAAARPQWLLNVTNDAWYGFTSGPFQHLAIARVRAVEEGLPLIRAANNGVSAVVDPYGRVMKRLALDSIGVLDSPLPRALPPTFYEHVRDMAFFALSLSLLAITAILTLTGGRA